MAKKTITDIQKRIAERRVARKLALFAIYQWQMTGNAFEDIYVQLQYDENYTSDFQKADAAFLHSLVNCAINHSEKIDALIQPHIDYRTLEQVDMIEQAALRLATCELLHHIETPYKVVVSEVVNITKKFGAEQGHKFVNGILTKLITQLRPIEIKANPKK